MEVGRAMHGYFTYMMNCDSDPFPELQAATELWRCLHPTTLEAEKLPAEIKGSNRVIAFVSEALNRLEKRISLNLVEQCRGYCGSHGLKALLQKLEPLAGQNLSEGPTYLRQLLQTVKAWDSVDESSLIVGIDKNDHAALLKHLPLYIKLGGMREQWLLEALPDKGKKVTAFTDGYKASLTAWMAELVKYLDGKKELLDKYRQVKPLLVVRSVALGITSYIYIQFTVSCYRLQVSKSPRLLLEENKKRVG